MDSPNVATDGEYIILYFDNGDIGLWDTFVELDDDGEIDDHDGDYDVVLMKLLETKCAEGFPYMCRTDGELSAELGGYIAPFPDPRVPEGMAYLLITADGYDFGILGAFMQMAFVPGIDVDPFSFYLAENYL